MPQELCLGRLAWPMEIPENRPVDQAVFVLNVVGVRSLEAGVHVFCWDATRCGRDNLLLRMLCVSYDHVSTPAGGVSCSLP